jgi:hypothetical protein
VQLVRFGPESGRPISEGDGLDLLDVLTAP